VIIAVAGRRIDAADAETPRFPSENVAIVEWRLDALFEREGATAVVSSAACGADLVALTVAGRRGMRRRVVLPFGREKFRETSVTDRPGDWGPTYDRMLAELDRTGDIVTLEARADGDEAYLAANERILREVEALARESNVEAMALLVWDGAPRSPDDVTAAFGHEARKRGWRVEQVKTV
jgi:broad specificity phosphatase PhoE